MLEPKDDETGGFREFELTGWQRASDRYDEDFSGLTSQVADRLLDAASVGRGTRLLDIACGPGCVAAAAAMRGARAIGIDFSPRMVYRARQRYPAIGFAVGDAESIPFEDDRFDAVVMSFGLLHLGRPELAVREARRVLRPDASLAFTVWASPPESVGFDIVLRAIERFGTSSVPLPPGPPFFRFSDPAESGRLLREAGFEAMRHEIVPMTWRLSSGADLYDTMLHGTVRTAALLRAQARPALSEIRDFVTGEAERYRRGAGVELPMPAVLVAAVSPA
jgi:SAM-dependent methyltransferase